MSQGFMTSVLVGAVLLTASHASGADARPSKDAATLRECMATGDTPDYRECIGTVANPCQEAPGGSTTLGITECLLREEAAWDVVLNETYKQVMDGLESRPRDAMRTAQRQWIVSRDADCLAAYAFYEDGTFRSVAAAACRQSATANRAIWLMQFVGN